MNWKDINNTYTNNHMQPAPRHPISPQFIKDQTAINDNSVSFYSSPSLQNQGEELQHISATYGASTRPIIVEKPHGI